jgi:hypothetical protein
MGFHSKPFYGIHPGKVKPGDSVVFTTMGHGAAQPQSNNLFFFHQVNHGTHGKSTMQHKKDLWS